LLFITIKQTLTTEEP